MNPRELAERAVDRIFRNLERSTWGDQFHEAKESLKEYREDMIEDVERVIIWSHRLD